MKSSNLHFAASKTNKNDLKNVNGENSSSVNLLILFITKAYIKLTFFYQLISRSSIVSIAYHAYDNVNHKIEMKFTLIAHVYNF